MNRPHTESLAVLPIFLLALASFSGTSACQPSSFDYAVRRPADGQVAFDPIEVGSAARPALALRDTPALSLRFNDLDTGSLVFYVAKRGASLGPATITAQFRCADPFSRVLSVINRRKPPGCSVHWGPEAVSGRWQPCRLRIGRSCGEGTLSVALAAEPAADVVLTEPLVYGHRRSKRPDVYFFVLDAARADRLQPFSSNLPIGRALTRLGEDSLVFQRARAPSSWTRPSTTTLLTGVHPDNHGVNGRRDVLPKSIPVIQQLLREQGYFTFALSANANILPIWGFARGFDEFHDVGATSWATAKTDARTLMDRLIDELETDRSRPGFYYVHLMDPHAPYQPSSADLEYVKANPYVEKSFPHPTWGFGRQQEIEQYLKYLAELEDADAEIGRFVDYLRAANRYRNSIIVVVADHGEEFRDHDQLYHGTGLFEEVLRVPLLIKLPREAKLSGPVATTLGIENLMPTLLAAVGIAAPTGIDGHSMITEAVATSPSTAASGRHRKARSPPRFELAQWLAEPPRPQFSTLKLDQARVAAVVDEPWKLIEYHHVERELLYNIQVDPLEWRNLAPEQPERVIEMRALLAARAARHGTGWRFLFCGGRSGTPSALRLGGWTGTLQSDGLEPDDVIGEPVPDGSRELRLALPLRSFEVEELGRLVERVSPDDDALMIPLDAAQPPPSLASLDSRPLRYTLGASRELRSSGTLDLSTVVTEATIDGHEWIECPLTETDAAGRAVTEENDPYIRIWRIDAPDTVDAKDLSPEIVERLKQLGYTW